MSFRVNYFFYVKYQFVLNHFRLIITSCLCSCSCSYSFLFIFSPSLLTHCLRPIRTHQAITSRPNNQVSIKPAGLVPYNASVYANSTASYCLRPLCMPAPKSTSNPLQLNAKQTPWEWGIMERYGANYI